MGDKRAKLVSKRKGLKGLEALSARIAALEGSLEGFAGDELMQGLMDGLRIRVERLEDALAELALGQRRTELLAELRKAPRPAQSSPEFAPVPTPRSRGLKPWEKAGIARNSWYRRRRREREAAAEALVAASVGERAKPVLMPESDGESDP